MVRLKIVHDVDHCDAGEARVLAGQVNQVASGPLDLGEVAGRVGSELNSFSVMIKSDDLAIRCLSGSRN